MKDKSKEEEREHHIDSYWQYNIDMYNTHAINAFYKLFKLISTHTLALVFERMIFILSKKVQVSVKVWNKYVVPWNME